MHDTLALRSSERFEVLNKVSLLRLRQSQSEMAVVVLDHIPQRREATVMVETAFLVGPETRQRCGSLHVGQRSIRLEGVHADLGWRMKVVSRLGE